MPSSNLKLIRRSEEFLDKSHINEIPGYTRGIYVLTKCHKKTDAYHKKTDTYNVVYIGMAGASKAGIRGRLKKHAKSPGKSKHWSHFSIYEVWENITEEEVSELEGLFRHIYRKDLHANKLNKQQAYLKLKQVRNDNISEWNS